MIKRVLTTILLLALVLMTLSCDMKTKNSQIYETRDILNVEENVKNKRIAIAYFSVNDDVKIVAEKFKEIFDADMIPIVPKVPYTDEDLGFDNPDSRVRLEDDYSFFKDSFPIEDDEYETSEAIVIATKNETKVINRITELPTIESNNANRYQIVILGFPVWLENAPKVVYTFLNNLRNTTIIPFCTNGDIGLIDQYLSQHVDNSVRVMSGKEFNRESTLEEIKNWVALVSADLDLK